MDFLLTHFIGLVNSVFKSLFPTNLNPDNSFSEFGLLYLDQLNNEGLNKFKLLLKGNVDPGCCSIPEATLEAKWEKLVYLINEYYPRGQTWNMALETFC